MKSATILRRAACEAARTRRFHGNTRASVMWVLNEAGVATSRRNVNNSRIDWSGARVSA